MSAFAFPIRLVYMGKLSLSNSRVPLAYHIVFRCYGTWLHGDASGSTHHSKTTYGSPFIGPDPHWQHRENVSMKQPQYHLDEPHRKLVLEAVKGVCSYREWELIVMHVRSTHVHVIVSADDKPERVMKDFKIYASRALNKAGFDTKDRKRWARHGSTKYLWKEKELESVIDYVLHEQGKPMEVYVRE